MDWLNQGLAGAYAAIAGATDAIDTEFVQHEVRVMVRKLKNVTVTLDDETARWARVEAARRDTSVSRMLGDLLRREMEGQEAYERAMERFFAQTPAVHRADGRPLPTRDELHDRASLR